MPERNIVSIRQAGQGPLQRCQEDEQAHVEDVSIRQAGQGPLQLCFLILLDAVLLSFNPASRARTSSTASWEKKNKHENEFQSGKPGKDLFNFIGRLGKDPEFQMFQSGKPGKDLFNIKEVFMLAFPIKVSIRQAGQGPLQR